MDEEGTTITTARQLQRKALFYNNIVDSDTALECGQEFLDHSQTC
ncbi:MAG: hypothetical protein V9819_02205 [Candidatus Dasytiphilus stammeri]